MGKEYHGIQWITNKILIPFSDLCTTSNYFHLLPSSLNGSNPKQTIFCVIVRVLIRIYILQIQSVILQILSVILQIYSGKSEIDSILFTSIIFAFKCGPQGLSSPLQTGCILCILSSLNSQRMRSMCPVCKRY